MNGTEARFESQVRYARRWGRRYWLRRRHPCYDDDDATQEALIGALKAAREWSPQCGHAWSTHSTKRMRWEIVRGAQRFHGRPGRVVPIRPVPLVEDIIGDADLATITAIDAADEVAALLRILPRRERTAIKHLYITGMSIRRLAQRMRCGRFTVWRLARQGMARLREAAGVEGPTVRDAR
jgi:RNA polymerase sigma factor (sigma-70 family)